MADCEEGKRECYICFESDASVTHVCPVCGIAAHKECAQRFADASGKFECGHCSSSLPHSRAVGCVTTSPLQAPAFAIVCLYLFTVIFLLAMTDCDIPNEEEPKPLSELRVTDCRVHPADVMILVFLMGTSALSLFFSERHVLL